MFYIQIPGWKITFKHFFPIIIVSWWCRKLKIAWFSHFLLLFVRKWDLFEKWGRALVCHIVCYHSFPFVGTGFVTTLFNKMNTVYWASRKEFGIQNNLTELNPVVKILSSLAPLIQTNFESLIPWWDWQLAATLACLGSKILRFVSLHWVAKSLPECCQPMLWTSSSWSWKIPHYRLLKEKVSTYLRYWYLGILGFARYRERKIRKTALWPISTSWMFPRFSPSCFAMRKARKLPKPCRNRSQGSCAYLFFVSL